AGYCAKVLSQGADAAQATAALAELRSSLSGAVAALDQLKSAQRQLAIVSACTTGASNAPGVGGPAAREGDPAAFKAATAGANRRLETVRGELAGLERDVTRTLEARGFAARFANSSAPRVERAVAGFNAFRNGPELRELRRHLLQRAGQSRPTAAAARKRVCGDAPRALAAARALDALPSLATPTLRAGDSAGAVLEALGRLKRTAS